MIQRAFGAATAACLLLVLLSGLARADVIVLLDGTVLPKRVAKDVDPEEGPTDAQLAESGRNNAELAYDSVKVSGQSVSASLVRDIYITTAYENEFYRNGENQARSSYWPEAADSFGEAAEALKGAGKEVSLYNRVICLAETRDLNKTFAAAQELLDAFPKSYYFAPTQIKRARIMLSRGDAKGARSMLDTITNASGMNARDYFESKIERIYLFEFKAAGKSKARYAAARGSYEQLVQEIEGRRGALEEAGIQRLKALVGIGKCHVYEGDVPKARPFFDKVISDKTSLRDKQLLAQAYTGLGDVVYASVKKELDGGKLDASRLPEVLDQLTEASLHYLRVAKFYVENAGDELYPATVGVARVWATQFTLTGEKDCDLAQRAAKFFFEAHKLLPRGEAKALLTSEVRLFLAKRDEACKEEGGEEEK